MSELIEPTKPSSFMRNSTGGLSQGLAGSLRARAKRGADRAGSNENDESSIQYELETKDFCLYYGEKRSLNHVNMHFRKNAVTAIIGPSGCGKSTLLRSFNRMNDFIEGVRITGQVLYDGKDLYEPSVDAADVRRKIGMVFQRPNPFPKSIYQNIIWGPKIHGFSGSADDIVEKSLRSAALWDEVKDRLHGSALSLSGGQQQRLCIARAIAMNPSVILMDEPCSALDPKSTMRIEELIVELGRDYTILVVTHNMQQAARISDQTAFMYEGDLIEFADTRDIFDRPANQQTADYIAGRFG